MSASDIFGSNAEVFTTYRATLKFNHVIVGGIPSDRSVIEGWIRSRMDLGDTAIQDLIDKTVAERGVISPDEAVAAVMESELAPSVNGFKRDENGELCIEGRIVKAAIKEYANSAYPGKGWPGKEKNPHTAKLHGNRGLLTYLSEAVVVPETLIGLGVKEPSRVEERIKHIKNSMGQQMSTISRVEVVDAPTITFTVRVRDDFLPQEAWGRIWAVGETIGLGSDRGRSDGQYELVEWIKEEGK